MVNNSTKRALVSSTLAILMCVSMLIGTTFAWFTDTASTAVNAIHSGTLTVDIVKEDGETSIQDQGISFVNVEGKSDILWEPGATFTTPVFKIKSTGTLALKYKLVLNGIDGDNDLLDVIRFSVVGEDGTEVNLDEFEGHLTPEASLSEALYIRATMDKAAGNDYQGKTLEGLGITVYATQDTVEKDGTGNEYDQNATYPVAVTNADELIAALQDKEEIVLANDITITSGVETAANLKQTLDFNGHKLILGGEDQWAYGYLDVCGELTLIDSVGNGGIMGEFYHSATKVPTAVFINDGAVVNLKSGTIENVYRGVANYYSGGTFNMTGGRIAVKQATEIESAGVLFRRGGTVNLTGGEISGAVYFEQTSTMQPNYTIGAAFTNTNNSTFHTSGITATQNADGIWVATIQ